MPFSLATPMYETTPWVRFITKPIWVELVQVRLHEWASITSLCSYIRGLAGTRNSLPIQLRLPPIWLGSPYRWREWKGLWVKRTTLLPTEENKEKEYYRCFACKEQHRNKPWSLVWSRDNSVNLWLLNGFKWNFSMRGCIYFRYWLCLLLLVHWEKIKGISQKV